MCSVDDMRDLAADLHKTAKEYRDTQPEIADRMVEEANDILAQFGLLDCPPPAAITKGDAGETEPDVDDPQMKEILRMMVQKNQEFIPTPEFPRRRRIIREFFAGL